MNDKQPDANDLAVERNILAADRTLMAWVRTSLAMISFGFTIYKFMQLFLTQNNASFIHAHEPRNVGLTLIGLGNFSLIIAATQHFLYIKSLRPGKKYRFWSDLSLIVACLLATFGFLLFGSIILDAGPFD